MWYLNWNTLIWFVYTEFNLFFIHMLFDFVSIPKSCISHESVKPIYYNHYKKNIKHLIATWIFCRMRIFLNCRTHIQCKNNHVFVNLTRKNDPVVNWLLFLKKMERAHIHHTIHVLIMMMSVLYSGWVIVNFDIVSITIRYSQHTWNWSTIIFIRMGNSYDNFWHLRVKLQSNLLFHRSLKMMILYEIWKKF